MTKCLRPFVYRRYLDFGVFESLREMKAMIAREVERRELRDNVKLGPGGIREIEFIVQALQLIRGGGDRRLQRRELRAVLPLLVGQRLLRKEAVAELDAAYRFLRIVENRLQQWKDEQTHQLPEDAAQRERLAFAMNAPDWGALEAELGRHRACGGATFCPDGVRPACKFRRCGSAQAPQLFPLEAAEGRACSRRCAHSDSPIRRSWPRCSMSCAASAYTDGSTIRADVACASCCLG